MLQFNLANAIHITGGYKTEMCKKRDYMEDKKRLFNDERYVTIYEKTFGILREFGLNPTLPGYELIRRACCIKIILEYENDVDVYNMLEGTCMIPLKTSIIKDIRSEEQWMIEVLRVAEIEKGALDFVSEICSKIQNSK